MNWTSAVIPGSTPELGPILSVLAKAAYTLGPEGTGEAEILPVLIASDCYSDAAQPAVSDVVAESDLVAFKPFTDVVIAGRAHAPNGRAAYFLDCGVRVGALCKTVRVYGRRQLTAGFAGRLSLGEPEAFYSQPLGYRYACGGTARSSNGLLCTCHRNPIGCGIMIRGAVSRQSLPAVPHLEDPASPLRVATMLLARYEDWPDAPLPASLGWTRRDFFPRYTMAGVLPEFIPVAERTFAEMSGRDASCAAITVPRMDPLFFQGASPGLWGGPLSGNESVTLRYLDPAHPTLEFALPADIPVLTLDIGAGPQELRATLQTVAIDTEEKQLTMLWRGSMQYDGVEQLATLRMLRGRARS